MVNFQSHSHYKQIHQNFDGVVCNGALNWMEKYETNRMPYVSSLDISSEKLGKRIEFAIETQLVQHDNILQLQVISFQWISLLS